ncbi:MAG: GIY-YIG nuclease family protein [Candidatus Hydrogenedentes bacterium]|nr:GIY-YIG nuclease family protein [Candidatus Hydrogenedentota bacterium]
MQREPAVYILASKLRGTLYIGVTSNPPQRISEHKTDAREGFTKKYNVKTLVDIEHFPTMREAIAREKQMKKWRRAWKIELIEKDNPEWKDLWQDFP